MKALRPRTWEIPSHGQSTSLRHEHRCSGYGYSHWLISCQNWRFYAIQMGHRDHDAPYWDEIRQMFSLSSIDLIAVQPHTKRLNGQTTRISNMPHPFFIFETSPRNCSMENVNIIIEFRINNIFIEIFFIRHWKVDKIRKIVSSISLNIEFTFVMKINLFLSSIYTYTVASLAGESALRNERGAYHWFALIFLVLLVLKAKSEGLSTPNYPMAWHMHKLKYMFIAIILLLARLSANFTKKQSFLIN